MAELQMSSFKLRLDGWSHLPVLISSALCLLSVLHPFLTADNEDVTCRVMNCESLYQLRLC